MIKSISCYCVCQNSIIKMNHISRNYQKYRKCYVTPAEKITKGTKKRCATDLESLQYITHTII